MGEDRTALANEVRLACQLVSRKVRFETHTELAPHQLAVMWKVKVAGCCTPGELAAEEQVTAPSMTKTLDSLEELGYIVRTKDPDDGRRRSVTLTDAGHAMLERTATMRDSWMEQRLSPLPDEDLAVLAHAARILQAVIW